MDRVASNPPTSAVRHRDRESVENMVMGEWPRSVVCRYFMGVVNPKRADYSRRRKVFGRAEGIWLAFSQVLGAQLAGVEVLGVWILGRSGRCWRGLVSLELGRDAWSTKRSPRFHKSRR